MLLELFAYLADQTLYRANRVPEASYAKMLRIMGVDLAEGESLISGIRRARLLLEERYRAITADDFIYLIQSRMEEIQKGLFGRALVMNNVDMSYISSSDTLEDIAEPGHISLIVIPNVTEDTLIYCDAASLPAPVPSSALLADIYGYLQNRRLVSTTLHVVGPSFVKIDVSADIVLTENAEAMRTIESAVQSIREYFDPVAGGPEGSGWPPGRSFHRSELYQLLEMTDGVDHVERTSILVAGNPSAPDATLKPWELISMGAVNLQVIH